VPIIEEDKRGEEIKKSRRDGACGKVTKGTAREKASAFH